MPSRLNRRDFVRSGAAAAGLGLAARVEGAPAILQGRPKPVVVSSANGNTRTHDGQETCVVRAFRLMTGGTDVLEALIAGVNIVELDPKDTSVGYGGLPNADGVVQLDSCCMHGPRKRAGGVAALEGVRTPSRVAYAVMQNTDHHLIVGAGAQRFARQMGFEIEDDLNTETSRKLWLEWKRRLDPEHFLDPEKRAQAGFEAGRSMVRDGLHRPGALLRHHQLQWPERQGRDLRRDHDQRAGLEDPWPGRRFTHPGRRVVCRWRCRRRRLDRPRRGQPLRAVLVPDRGAAAPGQVAQGRRHGGPSRA